MTVTAIIPVHNGAATIERAVKSAIDAGCERIKIFDDASTDDTYQVSLKLQDTYRDVWVYSTLGHRVGASVARNILINFSNDDSLIVCLDHDDTLHDITPLIAAYEPNTWVYGDYNQVTGSDVQRIKGAPAGTLARKNITGVTFLFSKQDWLKCGGYNPNYAFAEDFAFQCNLTHNGVKPKYVETIVYDRHLRPEGNERTVLAGEYWNFYHQMCRRDYPSVFTGS